MNLNIRKIFFSVLFIVLNLLCTNSNAQTSAVRKSFFLSDAEKIKLKAASSTSITGQYLSGMQARVYKRANSISFDDKSVSTEWWHHVSEYLTDAALIHSVRPSDKADAWLRSSILAIVRRPNVDWTGPGFRGGNNGPIVGTLETAHLAWGVALAYDMSADLFTPAESEEILLAIKEKGLIPCKKYLTRSDFYHNWNCVLYAGFTACATLLKDEEAIKFADAWMPIAIDHFQKDGSYGESLQYGNYAAYSVMIAQEALARYSNSKGIAKVISVNPYDKFVNWSAHSLLYKKPLSGWPTMDWPRSVNFGDTGSIFRPSADLLVHISVHAKKESPKEAGLATWLLNTLYSPNEPGPHDLASFGFVNDYGFLTVMMLADVADPISPSEAKLPLTTSFSGGDVFARDAWASNGGLTTLATRIPGIDRQAAAHIHGDINSFLLMHNKEPLLVDPGHTCYRNLTRELDASSETHNTCTFETLAKGDVPARKLIQVMANKEKGYNRFLKQVNEIPQISPLVNLLGDRLITARSGNVSVIGSNAAPLYGAPITNFSRFFVLCGSHTLFVIDQIAASEPIKTTWNFLLNNRDGLLDMQLNRNENSIHAQRGNAGIVIKNHAKGRLNGPIYALVHDAYHVLPNQSFTEGEAGSGLLMRWQEPEALTNRTIVHTIAFDDPSAVKSWEIAEDKSAYTIKSTDRNENWTLSVLENDAFEIKDVISGNSTVISKTNGTWGVKDIKKK